MATCLEVITGAGSELGTVALGDTLPAEEATRGLTVLQSMYREAVDKGVFGRVEEYLAEDDYEAEEGQRVYSAGFTITLPTTVEDEITGEDRRPRDLAMIQVVNAATDPQISIYDAHLAAWVRIDNLTLAGEAPFSNRNRHGLECALAARLSSTYRAALQAGTAGVAFGLAGILTNRFAAPRRATQAEYF